MIRHLVLAAPLALGLISTHALAAGKTPPPEYAAYVAAVRKADTIADPLQRCLAYPDLPGNTWAPDVAKARCRMFNTPPIFTLDSLEAALAQPDGAKAVDAKFATLLDEHFTVPAQREQIFIGFGIFKSDEDDKAERIARKWLAASPDSAFAHTALGKVLENRGWDARGGKYMRDTPTENVERMDAYFLDAVKEYGAALEANPKLLPACVAVMAIGRQSSGQAQAWASKVCMDADPASYYVVDEMMTAAEPRWGGSDAAMRAVDAYAQARVKDNPVLAVFAFHHAFYVIDRAEDGDAQVLAVLEPATALVPNAAYLRTVGGAYLRKDDWWKTFVYLSQALRFMPDYARESHWRAFALYRLGEPEWARADAERAVALDPDDAWAHQMLAYILRDTVGRNEARPHFMRAMQEPKLREEMFIQTCWMWYDAKPRNKAEAVKCSADLVKEYPGNGEAWRVRFMALGPDAPETDEAMQRFLATHDPKRWPRHATDAETVRTLLAVKEGRVPPPASDDFDARVRRASAMEVTQAGRDYLKRILPQVGPGFTEAINRCAQGGARPADSFTAVFDIRANGAIANVVVAPVNPLASCFAKHLAEVAKPSPPPAMFAEHGFPMVLESSFKGRK